MSSHLPDWLHHVPVVGVKGQLSFEQILELLFSGTVRKFNYSDSPELERCGDELYVRVAGESEYVFHNDAAAASVFDGSRLAISDVQGFVCVFEFSDLGFAYLCNATGDATGHGTLEVSDDDVARIPFESGPGVVLPYVTEILGRAYLQGNLEIAFKDDFWGIDGKDLDPEPEVRRYCAAALEFIRPRLTDGAWLLPLDEGDPGRFIVQVAVPLDVVIDREDALLKLEAIFGPVASLADEATWSEPAAGPGKLYGNVALPSTADADRLLGLSDQFMEDWKADDPADAERVERQAEYAVIRPLFVAAPEMFGVLQRIFPSLELLPDGAFRMTVPDGELRQWIGIVKFERGQWQVEHNYSTEQFGAGSLVEGLEVAARFRAGHIEDIELLCDGNDAQQAAA
jgi:hypothetical protein